VTNWQKQIFQ